ncbi:hypothetical protein LAZ67_4001469, partial [Cordylochernes scorpioides]
MKRNRLLLKIKHGNWDLIIPDNAKAIGCKWIFRIKRKGNGEIDRYRARLVSKGFSQRRGIDYKETFAPVVRYDSVRVLLALATVMDMEIMQFDIKTAFLNGDLDEDIYMQIPEGIEVENKNLVCKLKKSLYGLKQSPRIWNEKFTYFLKQFQLTQSQADPCVFYQTKTDAKIFLALYVDDGIMMSTSNNLLKELAQYLSSHFEVTISTQNQFVGLEIDKEKGLIFLSQTSYIKRILDKFNMTSCNSSGTPVDPNMKLTRENINDTHDMHNVPYAEAIGCLMFLAVCTRPDIAFAELWTQAFYNQRQSVVALSTTEAEYIAASMASREAVWLKLLIKELTPNDNPVPLMIDNQSAIRLILNPEFHKRTKHVDVKFHFIREQHKMKIIKIFNCPTEEQLADLLTKALPATRFKRLFKDIGMSALLSKELMKAWQRSPLHDVKIDANDSTQTRVDLIMEFLQKEAAAEQDRALAGSKFGLKSLKQDRNVGRQSHPAKIPTASGLFAGRAQNCIFCNKDHKNTECLAARRMSIKERREHAVTMKKVSCMDFYAYRIMIRAQESNHILKCRQLFQQFIVDMYAKVESERLNYIRFNQSKLRADQYIHLRDAIANDGAAAAANIGQMVILPASYAGSPRHMHEYAQDAMTYVRTYGRPDLFLTFTCNPAWAEIKNLLLPGQQSSHRHDLTARVFKQKLKCFIDLIVKNHIYGPTRCWMYSIEWQKRGTPHAHILIWLEEKILPTQIDNIISAELPDPQEDPELYQIIKKYMIHGPCGAQNPHSPCIKDGKCTKKYPRDLVHDTQTGGDGYPLYRQKPEDGGHTATIKLNHVDFEVDNRWIVPYSPLLSKAFDAHINVEYCNSVKSIKYICKYVNKGSDMAVFGLQNPNAPVNEIDQFQMGRYISSNEAVWRILGFDIHERSPAVIHLSVHLENGQRVYFTEESVAQRAENPPNTTLTAFFQLCASDTFAATLLYHEVPTYYTWNQSMKKWQRRKQGMLHSSMVQVFSTGALGRVYTVHPSNAECYYLRMLLHVVKGPKSFEAIKTVNGQICQTYREACFKLGLLENDQHWDNTLAEASETCHPKQIRTLFAIILTTCSPSDPKGLWEKHKESMSEDILRCVHSANPNAQNSDEIFNEALISLEDICLSINNKILNQLGLISPERGRNDAVDRDMLREMQYDADTLQVYVETQKRLLTNEQNLAYNTVTEHVRTGNGGLLFLDAPGGTGKTFLLNLILAEIPDVPLCNIGKTSGMATVLKTCQIIIWDECTMAHKKALEALDRTLRDFRGNQRLMGGALILLAGDFRQILPVIPRATPADELNACLKKSALWRHVKKITLSTNMRVHLHGDVSAQTFAKQLLNMGNGKIPVDPATHEISFPPNFCQLQASIGDLEKVVFPDIATNFKNHDWLCERAILAPKNDDVNRINHKIQLKIPGAVTQYKSIDTVTEEDQAVNYPVEFLNSLEPPGMPPHVLSLKVGSPILLFRNLNTPKLCNGTRLSVKRLMPNVIETTIISGKCKGEDVLIPRIPMIPTDLPFTFKRLQFPANAHKSPSAILELSNLAEATRADLVLLQELPAHFNWPSSGFQTFNTPGSYIPSGIVARSYLQVLPIESSDPAITSIAIWLGHSPISVISAYWHGQRDADDFLPHIESINNRFPFLMIIGMDANAHSPCWGINGRLDSGGENLEDFARLNDLHVLGPPERPNLRKLVLSLHRCSHSTQSPIRSFFCGLYRACHNRLKAAIRKAKSKCWLNLCNEVSATAWSAIHRFIAQGRKPNRGPPLLQHNDGSPFTPEETSRTVLEHFLPPDNRPHPPKNDPPPYSDEPDFHIIFQVRLFIFEIQFIMEDEILNKNFDDDSETENYSLNESSDVSTDEECDSILTTVQMSSRKSKTPKSKELSLPTQIVLDISRPLWKSNRNITADNWFTSIELVDKLKEHGLTYLGTMRKNKPQIPPQFQPHPKRESGTSIFGFSGTKTLVSYVPKKRKSVILISSMHHDDKCDETTGKPDIIMDYNLTKGGVDTIDQMVSNFFTSRRSRRWPLALFYALLDITALNSYIIFNYQIDKKDKKERSTFIVDLGRSLIDEHLATHDESHTDFPQNENREIEIEPSTSDTIIRPQRLTKIPKRYEDFIVYSTQETPKTYEEAINSKNKYLWHLAMIEEINSMNIPNVWKIVDRPKDQKVIKSKWVFTIKHQEENPEPTFKARLVATGYNQTQGIDFEENFSPVMRHASLRTFLTIAAKINLEIKMYDVKSAYLNGHMDKPIYMEPPPGFKKDNKVYYINKSIYGLPQSGRCWYNELCKNSEIIEHQPIKDRPMQTLSHTAQYDIRSSIAHILRKPTPTQSQSPSQSQSL